MGTIYVDKYTALETMNSVLRIRHHSEHMQIQATIQRDDIRLIASLKPEPVNEFSGPFAVSITTVDEQVVMIPVWTDDDMRVMFKSLHGFWVVSEAIV